MMELVIAVISQSQTSEFINSPYILLREDAVFTPSHHSEISHPFLEGIRLLSNVEIVISEPEALEEKILAGKVTARELQDLVIDNSPFIIVSIKVEDLYDFLDEFLLNTQCTANREFNIPELHGMLVFYKQEDCFVNNILLCTWYVSSSDHCRRWSAVQQSENINVAILETIFLKYNKYFEKSDINQTYTLKDGAVRFTEEYFDHPFDNFTFSDFYLENTSHMLLKVILLLFVICCLIFNIRMCYLQNDDQLLNNKFNDLQLEDDSELLFFPTQNRKTIVEELASEKELKKKKSDTNFNERKEIMSCK